MKVTQEKLPDSQVGLEIEISPEASKQTYDQVLGKLMKSVNIPGFRRGKVPRQILIQRLGSDRIKASVIEEIIQTNLEKALEQEDIAAIGNYQLRSSFEDMIKQFKPGDPFTFSATVDVPPEVTLTDYEKQSVQAEEVSYDPARVDEVLEDYRKRNAILAPVEERAAQLGDTALVDFVGKLPPEEGSDAEPEEFEGGSAEDFQVELEEGRFIPGFIDGIVGMEPGETKDVSVTFPEDYPQEDLANKPAVFTITLHELKEKELPDLDDDFAQEISEFETLDALKENLENQFKQEAEDKTRRNKEEAILQELIQHIDVELPKTLIDQEINYMLRQTATRLSQQGIDVNQLFTEDMIKRLQEQSRPEAATRLKRTLALGEVAKQKDIKVDSGDIDAKVQDMLKDIPPVELQNIDQERLRSVVEEDLLREKIIDWLDEHWDVELVPEGTLSPAEEETAAGETAAAAVETATEASEATVDVSAEASETETSETSAKEASEEE
jgi:trigger factor